MNKWQSDNSREKPTRWERSFYDRHRVQWSIHPFGRSDKYRQRSRKKRLDHVAAMHEAHAAKVKAQSALTL